MFSFLFSLLLKEVAPIFQEYDFIEYEWNTMQGNIWNIHEKFRQLYFWYLKQMHKWHIYLKYYCFCHQGIWIMIPEANLLFRLENNTYNFNMADLTHISQGEWFL